MPSARTICPPLATARSKTSSRQKNSPDVRGDGWSRVSRSSAAAAVTAYLISGPCETHCRRESLRRASVSPEPALAHSAAAPTAIPAASPSTAEIVSISCRSSNGFVSPASAPSFVARLARSESPIRPLPDIAMIRASGRSRRSSMMSSMPSLFGMMMSVNTTSGACCRNFRRPSDPSMAVRMPKLIGPRTASG